MPLHLRTLLAAAFLLTCLAPSSGYAHEIKFGSLVVVHPWSREAPNGETDGFMKIANNGTEDDRLVGATADISSKVILCDVKREGDALKMVVLPDGIPIPAGATVELNSKSFHIMFLNVKSPPVPNTEFRGTLTFEKTGTLQLDFEVEEPE
jgi:periplasmic copper chaperone A